MKRQTTWDLSPLGKKINDSAFLKERELMAKKYSDFARKWKKDKSFLTDEKSLKKALDQYEKLSQLGTKEMTYLSLRKNVETTNIDIQKAIKKAEEFYRKRIQEIRFFGLELGAIDKKQQKIFIQSPELKKYKHYLEMLFNESRFYLSEKEENILSLKSGVAHGNWQSMLSEFLSKQSREVYVEEGKKVIKKEQTFSEIQSLIHHPKKKIRNTAAKVMHGILSEHSDIAEKEFNSILENAKINAELRGYERPDHGRITSDDITFDIVDTMAEVVSDNFNVSKNFYAFKAKVLKQDKLAYHERNLEVGTLSGEHDYETSISIVDAALSNVDEGFVTIYRDMVDTGKIDVYPRKGKRGGAFCSYWSKDNPVYVMLNHTNQILDTTTLAHEIGHAIHGTLTKQESAINYDTPMFVAEIASNFCEEYVFDEIGESLSDKEQFLLNIKRIDAFISSVFRQIAAYNFERNVHDEFAKEGYLSKKQIGALFTKHMKSYMGSRVNQDPGSENWWVYWSHFRSPFYVYSYASGLLLANAMRAKVKENPEYIASVKKFFSTGTSMSPQELFDSIGIDITDPHFWQSGIDEIKDLLTETQKLAKKLGKI
ncbi:MAG: M3 family oligoendopeptidase [Candidatus Pacebacteria bacterium]|nr:M3 family oligoendopeptidase [Candidatus Paceibacterota bacterium]